jgi:hypothetical protein
MKIFLTLLLLFPLSSCAIADTKVTGQSANQKKTVVIECDDIFSIKCDLKGMKACGCEDAHPNVICDKFVRLAYTASNSTDDHKINIICK